MSVDLPAHRIPRQNLGTHVGNWVKSIAPPKASPETPELLKPTNPVPEFMQSLGLAKVNTAHTLEPDLLHGDDVTVWDGKKLRLFLLRDKTLKSPFNGGNYPGPIIRIPRGVIFHAKVHGHGGSPHTIHWHGIEPTPMNDGVGHCSFEVGHYTYQWQPNHIGTYFYHCHKNTVQHYKFGLYSLLIIEPPDAFQNGPGRNPGGYPRRTAANLSRFPEFPGFVGGTLENGDPHAMTFPYDVEASWAIDDMDPVWLEKMRSPQTGLARAGSQPGVNDRFGRADFHDYNPRYFFLTGVNFPGRKSATLPKNRTVPPALNSGVSGMQISVNAKVNQTILVRLLAAGYSHMKVKFPVDGVVISFDGRALGIPPFEGYNRPFVLPAGNFIDLHTAERKELIFRSSVPVNSFAEIEYREHRSDKLLFTGKVPFVIS